MTNTNTMNLSVIAQALIDNRDYANKRITGNDIGVVEARQWRKSVADMRLHAYDIYSVKFNSMGSTGEDCDESALFNALKVVTDLIGKVDGRKLNARNIADMIIAKSAKTRKIDTSAPMAHAHFEKRQAKKALDAYDPDTDNLEELQANYDKWAEECERLENEPGNQKKVHEVVSESAFVREVEIILGCAIHGETIKTAAQVQAEEDAKKAANKAKSKANRAKKAQAKKEAEAQA